MNKFYTGFFILLILFFVPVFSNKVDSDLIPSFKDSTEKYFLVEFNDLIYDDDKESLKEIGVEIISYKGRSKFLTKFDKSLIKEVESFDFIKSVERNKKVKSSKNMKVSKSEKKMYTIDILDETILDDLILKVESLGGEVLDKSKKRVRVRIDTSLVDSINEIEEVNFAEPFSFMKILNDNSKGTLNVYNHFDNLGLYGEGQTVAVADTGLDIGVVNSSLHADFLNKSITIDNFVWNGVADDGASDLSSGHGTHVSGSVLGTGILSGANLSTNNYSGSYSGTAPKANLYFQALEVYYLGAYYLFTPSSLNDLFSGPYTYGSKIHSNSWGNPSTLGDYDSQSVDVDSYTSTNKDLTILFAAGNCGTTNPQCSYIGANTITTPATAKNALTIGASNGDSSIAGFSSKGPTDDGRIKPDLVAPGNNIISTRSHVAASGLWAHIDSNYELSGGTSMATPLAAGVVALLREYLDKNKSISNPSSALIKAMLINGAKDITGTVPDMNQGWGLIDLNATIYEDENFNLTFAQVDSGLSTSSEFVYNFTINKADNPLKITVVWTDSPGTAGAGIKLVNDIDIVLTGPDGSEFFGNDFSAPYNDTKDSLNNVEGIRISNPDLGDYSLKVKGYNIPEGPQPFSYVISRDDFELPLVNFIYPEFDSSINSDNKSFNLIMNFTKNITSLSYYNVSSNIDLTSNLINGNSINMTFNVSSFGEQSLLFNFTDFQGVVNSDVLNFTLIENPKYTVNSPLNNSVLNLTKLSFFANISFTKNISSLTYEIDGHSFDVSDLFAENVLTDYLDIVDYGLYNVSFNFIDIDEEARNFTLLLNFSSTLLNNLTDYDEDGINNSIDTLLGNESNVNTNLDSLNITINSSSDLNLLFNNTFDVVIGNSSEKIVEFSNNFTNNTIDLTKVVIKQKVENNNTKIFVRGIDLETSKTKTIYLKLNGDVSKSKSLCLKDSEVFSFGDITSTCSGDNETFISSIPLAYNGYNLTYINSSNESVKITGLKHSGVAQMCTEDWNYSSWSVCSSSSQSRTAIDLNSCSTTFTREALVQSCDSGDGGSGGGGGGGGSSSSSSSEDEEVLIPEEPTPRFKVVENFEDDFNIFVNGVLNKDTKNYSGIKKIKLKDKLNGLELLSFDYNFSDKELNLDSVSIDYKFDGVSYIILNGFSTLNLTKRVSLKNNLDSNKVCVKDMEIDSILEISEDCSGFREQIVSCDGEDYFSYSCILDEQYYRVSGLKNSAVKEFVDDKVVETKEVLNEFDIDRAKILEEGSKDNIVINENNILDNGRGESSNSKMIILSILILFVFFIIAKLYTISHHKKKSKLFEEINKKY